MIPYRYRRVLRHLLVTILVLILVAAALGLCWLLWLGRYVVYTRDGAKLDFSLNGFSQGVAPEAPGTVPTVDITFGTTTEKPVTTELTRFSGVSVSVQELTDNFDSVSQQLLALPEGSTIALQIKDVKGYFYYSSDCGRQSGELDVLKMDQLLADLKAKGHYLIARLPAFQDYYYFLDNERERVPYGLPRDGGNGALWLDNQWGCYWFDPATDGCISYLIQQITELRALGFREVLLEDFRFPNTDMVEFPEDQAAALDNAAATLVKTCATETFAVSFGLRQLGLTIPQGRTRIYLNNVAAADTAAMAAQAGFADAAAHVGFLTELHDTRFDDFCVLRPLSALLEE